jgi:ubiquinone/menaquinone biosynthesis C-methylase UbiE|tara:strand:+ start:230 stop:928 length:699 start_codon:yes stop_codon:yes gene_type:complete
MIRNHDKIYLNENRKNKTKEQFKFLYKKSLESRKDKKIKICDVGCATGDFLYYLSNSKKNLELNGIDVRKDLLLKAKKEVKNCNFILGDISNLKTLPNINFDVVYMNGVLSIFDDYEKILNNFLKLIKPKGSGYIFGIFNTYDVDVTLRIRTPSNNQWESGWNLFSKSSISKFLKEKKIQHKFFDWKINIDIPKHKDDPLRSWTFKDAKKSRLLINGIQLVHTFSLLEIKQK